MCLIVLVGFVRKKVYIYLIYKIIALVSPKDLYISCTLLQSLNLPYTLKKYSSGLLVLQPANVEEDVLMKKVIECIPGDGVFVVEIARMVSAKSMYCSYTFFCRLTNHQF